MIVGVAVGYADTRYRLRGTLPRHLAPDPTMLLLVLLTSLLGLASIAATSGRKSRAEAVITTSLTWNALVAGPIYLLGLTDRLDRLGLGLFATGLAVLVLGLYVVRHRKRAPLALLRRTLSLALLPLEGIRRCWQRRSLVTVGAALALAMLPYMLLVAYLAPTWRDWDGLWYHESLTGFSIQNRGFSPVNLPPNLQVINGTQRLAEMTQLWFGIYGGRRVIDVANVLFMPMLAASMFALTRRYTREIVSGVAWAAALLLLPGHLRLVQSTMVDPQAAALLLAAAYFVTHPDLDLENALWGVLAMTLAVGAKIWHIVPIGLLSLFLLVRLIRRARANGSLKTAGVIALGTAGVIGMQATTYWRNWIHFKNPFWPMLGYDNPKLGIHWKGIVQLDVDKGARAGVDFNEPFPVFVEKMLAAPHKTMGPGHAWQVNDYGFAWAWVVLPLLAIVVAVLAIQWLSAFLAVSLGLRARGPADDLMASAAMLAFVATVSLVASPALFIARYHIASLGMLLGALAWFSSRLKSTRLSEDAALVAQLGSFLMAFWGPQTSTTWVYLYDLKHVARWIRTPYPDRELKDIGTKQTPKMGISPVNLETGRAREREVGRGDVVGFDRIDFVALLWNNDYSNRVVWLDSTDDPLGQAEEKNAVWVYTRGSTKLHSQVTEPGSGWELVGPLEAEAFGSVYRRKK
jgi:hypothetical protein